MIALWILVAVSTVVGILVIAHFCGVKVYDTTEKIYKSFTEEAEEKKGEKNV